LRWTEPITLGVERGGGVRSGPAWRHARRADIGTRFADPAGLARWPAPDRDVVRFNDADSIVEDLCRRWLSWAG
jgi:hypothetical protein